MVHCKVNFQSKIGGKVASVMESDSFIEGVGDGQLLTGHLAETCGVLGRMAASHVE